MGPYTEFRNDPGPRVTDDKYDEHPDYYAILGIRAKASQQEVREAFFRLKNTYNESNQALYSLVDDLGLQDSLAEIREAWEVLGDPEKRQQYDLNLTEKTYFNHEKNRPDQQSRKQSSRQVQPVREKTGSSDLSKSALPEVSRNSAGFVIPSTTTERKAVRADCTPVRGFQHKGAKAGAASQKPRLDGIEIEKPYRLLPAAGARKLVASDAMKSGIQKKIQDLIDAGDPGDGALYKKIRTLVGISQEEMQDHIKISIGYIKNLEENCFDLLPQEVYVKGFLKSYLRFLGVPESDRLVGAYTERLKHWAESRRA